MNPLLGSKTGRNVKRVNRCRRCKSARDGSRILASLFSVSADACIAYLARLPVVVRECSIENIYYHERESDLIIIELFARITAREGRPD